MALISATMQIEPKHQAIQVSTNEELKAWDYKFDSVNQFKEILSQPNLKVLSSGETDDLYYCLTRTEDALLVVFWFRDGVRFDQSRGKVSCSGESDGIIREESGRLIPLLSTDVTGPQIKGITLRKKAVQLYGFSYPVKKNFTGKIIVDYKAENASHPNGASFKTDTTWN